MIPSSASEGVPRRFGKTGRACLAVAALALLARPVAGQMADGFDADVRPEVRAVRALGEVRIDGRLDEPAWEEAASVTGFTQMDPFEGQPVSQPTEARILFDDEALYVGLRLHDSGRVTTRLGRRDMELLDADWVGVVIDSYHDHRTAFSFDVNPGGVQRDAVKSMRGGEEEFDDLSWDAVWDVATTIDQEGWTAEYRIPFSQLRFGDADEHVWGIQLERVIGRNREYAVLAFTPKSERGGIARYGHLRGLGAVEPGKRLELLPYAVVRGEYVDQELNPYRSDAEQTGTAGLDVRYRLTSDLTLNASLNPDFGQVEVDPAVINLGVYETFFQEKRPFFVEGSEIFNFDEGNAGGQLFYSRRIGRPPQISTPTSLADVPDVTTILGATKISGKTESGWSVGILEAVTPEESARYRTPEGVDQRSVVEPWSNYFVGRVRRDMRAGASSAGVMVTAVHRDLSSELARAWLRSSAYAAGLDFHHEWANRAWAVRGSFVGSRIAGDAEALGSVQRQSNHYFQRPDADHLGVDPTATSLSGYSTSLSLAKQAGEHWRGEVGVALTSPGYEVNDLGFAYRTDRRDAQAEIRYVENTPGTFLRRWSASVRTRYESNYDGQHIANWTFAHASFTHLSYWSGFISVRHSFDALDDRLTRGGPLALRPGGSAVGVNVASDGRKPVTVHLGAQLEEDNAGGWARSVDLDLGIKSSSRWNLTLGPEISRARVAAQYITGVPDPAATATFGNRYLFAELDQTTVAMETRLNVTFTPRLSLELYAQPFLSSGDYGRPVELLAPRTFDFEPYGGDTPNLDFNYRSLRGNAVLRWEWKPGSTLYLAWQQTRSDIAPGVGDFDFGRDRSALFRAQPDNIFLIKVNYWISP